MALHPNLADLKSLIDQHSFPGIAFVTFGQSGDFGALIIDDSIVAEAPPVLRMSVEPLSATDILLGFPLTTSPNDPNHLEDDFTALALEVLVLIAAEYMTPLISKSWQLGVGYRFRWHSDSRELQNNFSHARSVLHSFYRKHDRSIKQRLLGTF